MRTFVVVLLLLSFLAVPAAVLCEPIQCEYALEKGSILEWIVCALVSIMMDQGEYVEGGYHTHWD